MVGHITLTRKAAKVKIKAASRAQYFFQHRDGVRYVRDVDVEEAARAFECNEKMRLRIRLTDSGHFAYAEKNRKLEVGYEIFFS